MRMHLSRSSTPARRRRGFTFLELLIAMTVAAVLMGITIPRMVPVRERASVRSAKQAVMGRVPGIGDHALTLGSAVLGTVVVAAEMALGG